MLYLTYSKQWSFFALKIELIIGPNCLVSGLTLLMMKFLILLFLTMCIIFLFGWQICFSHLSFFSQRFLGLHYYYFNHHLCALGVLGFWGFGVLGLEFRV